MSSDSKTLALCRCCLDDKHLSELWLDNIVNGERENYGEMLTECFGFEGSQWIESEGKGSMICEDCINRLQDAYAFKQQIHKADRILLKMQGDCAYHEESVKDDMSNCEDDVEIVNTDSEGEQLDEDFIATEYLDMDLMDGDVLEEDVSRATDTSVTTSVGNDHTMLEQPQESRKQDSELSEPDEAPKTQADITRQFHEEIRTVLTYTNGTPFKKMFSGEYQCMYCPEPLTCHTLRKHVRTSHPECRVDVAQFMTPPSVHEILKLDIKDLQCTVCVIPLPTWNDMFKHLHEVHDMKPDLACTNIIPYQIEEDLHCVLCDLKFIDYSKLDIHMNSHYNNYICSTCGAPFLTNRRLSHHLLMHDKGIFPCHLCGKILRTERYRVRHINYFHERKPMFICSYCRQRFVKEDSLQKHLVQQHKDTTKHACHLCPKEFDLRTYLMKHLRLMHGDKKKNFKCKLCEKRFKAPYELRNHEKWHKDSEDLVCEHCNTKVSSKQYLQKHREKCKKNMLRRRCALPQQNAICFVVSSEKGTTVN